MQGMLGAPVVVARWDCYTADGWFARDVLFDTFCPDMRDWTLEEIAVRTMEDTGCDGVYLVCPD